MVDVPKGTAVAAAKKTILQTLSSPELVAPPVKSSEGRRPLSPSPGQSKAGSLREGFPKTIQENDTPQQSLSRGTRGATTSIVPPNPEIMRPKAPQYSTARALYDFQSQVTNTLPDLIAM